jgi:hypothetical protein
MSLGVSMVAYRPSAMAEAHGSEVTAAIREDKRKAPEEGGCSPPGCWDPQSLCSLTTEKIVTPNGGTIGTKLVPARLR